MRKTLLQFTLLVFAFGLTQHSPIFSTSIAHAASICAGGLCVNVPNSRKRRTRRTRSRSRSKSRRSSASNTPSAVSGQSAWTTIFAEDKYTASNSAGLSVTYNDLGEIVLFVDIKNHVDLIKPTAKIPVRFELGRGGNYSASGFANETATILIVSGPVAYSIVSGLKSGSTAKVGFIGNNYSVRLRGSGNAIEQVFVAADQWKLLRKDKLDDARKEQAEADIVKRPKKKVDTLQIADDSNKGVRPSANLRDGPRKVSDLRVQYYVPGTREIGEMWVNWDVDDKGLFIGLNFIDPDHKYDNKAHTIRIPFKKGQPACNQDLKKTPEVMTDDCRLTRALMKSHNWQKTLEDKKYTKAVSKTLGYVHGKTDSQKAFAVDFKRYEDGGYAVQLEDRKFGVSKLFNFTIANALDLARITQDAINEANQKSITEDEIDDILK